MTDKSKYGARIKGGTRFDPDLGGWIAIIHVWPNQEGTGEHVEYTDKCVFPTELMAMGHYQQKVRPAIDGMREKLAKMEGIDEIRTLLREELN
jgi:hypothetical protein